MVVACDGSGPVVRSARQHPARTEPTPRLPGASGLRRVGAGDSHACQGAVRRRYGIHVVRLRLGLRKEMPLGDRRAGRFSARGLFRPDAYDLHAPAELHSVEHPVLRAVRHRAFHDRSLSQSDYGRGLLGARIRQIPRRQLLRLHLAPADASLRRAAFHVLPEKRQFAASYHALLRIERQRPRHRRQMRE